MFCKNCGKEIQDDAKFCNGCGAVQNGIEEKGDTKAVQPTVRRSKPMIIWGVIIIIAAAIGIYLVYSEMYAHAQQKYDFYSTREQGFYDPYSGYSADYTEQNEQETETAEENMATAKNLMIAIGGVGGVAGILLICLGSVKKPRY